MRNINRKLCFNLILIFNGYAITTESYEHEIFSNDDTHLSRIMYNELIREIEHQQRFLRSVTDMSATSTAESSPAETITEGSGETAVTETTSDNAWISIGVGSDRTSASPSTYMNDVSLSAVTQGSSELVTPSTSNISIFSATTDVDHASHPSIQSTSHRESYSTILSERTSHSTTPITDIGSEPSETSTGITSTSIYSDNTPLQTMSVEQSSASSSGSTFDTTSFHTYLISIGQAATDATILTISPLTPESTGSQATLSSTVSVISDASTSSATTSDTSLYNSTMTATVPITTTATPTTTTATPTTTTATQYTPENCNSSSLVELPKNNTCVSKESALIFVHQTLNSPNATNDDKAKALALYFVSVNVSSSSPASNSTNNLSLTDIERIVDNLTDVTANISSSASFIVARSINQTSGEDIVLGASVYSQRTGEIVTTNNKGRIISNSSLTTAAIIDNTTLDGVTSLSVLIINDPTSFRNADNTTNKTIASSIVIVSVQPHHFIKSINISLYFRLLNGSRPSDDLDYRCSYFNTTNHTWEEHGCSPALYNHIYNRYECYCNHNTSFALIWTPKIPLTSHLDAQDIASLVAQFISITCFIIVIVHGLATQLTSRLGSVQARLLLPLISTAATTLLFIFYIALALTVYKNTPSSTSTNRCFMSSSVLMFITYFLLIFMFCVKSSVGYFNYLRFVHLFPEPSHGRLYFLLFLSLVVSALCTSLAVGLNSNAALNITELYRFKLCWFSRSVNYYFLTIPACLFVLVNVVMLIIVGSRIVSHARHATSRHQSYERMKRCVLVLMSSSISQGVGWVFGPLIGIDNKITVTVFGWIFVILIGLEGLWTITLYIIIRLQHMDEAKRITAQKDLTKSTKIPSAKRKEKLDTHAEQKRYQQVHRRSTNELEKSTIRENRGDVSRASIDTVRRC
ncbi:unnamed protein product [Adineta ricciae]|uniref:Uncharacterized protein n=1 Tax=Adineta ricciae TaxID=249248 RepID=A0A814HS37_ADIRI|nr:unnamed protein product [Adineta ricciae]